MSRDLAEKLIGSDNIESAIGQTIKLNQKTDFYITGIFENLPNNSSFTFNYAIDFKQRLIDQPWDKEWDNFNNNMFVLLKEGSNLPETIEKIKTSIADNRENSQEAILY